MFFHATHPPPALLDAISHPRLSSYRRFFGTTSDAEALGLYSWNDELSAALFRVVSIVEIVLRNQFHKGLSRHLGHVGSSGSKDWYNYLALPQLSYNKIRSITHTKNHGHWLPKNPVPSPDDVVSKLTFGFWPHLLDTTHLTTGAPVPWGAVLVDVLPGHRQSQVSHWNKQKHQDEFFGRMDLCNELRNRIAHHEPVWKLGPLMKEMRPRPNKLMTQALPAPTTPSDSLMRLQLLYARLVELLGWLSPPAHAAFVGSSLGLR